MKSFPLVLAAVLALASFGCKKKTASGPDCAKAINRSMELSKPEMEKSGTDAQMAQKMTDLGIRRCSEDKWPAEAVNCMVDAKTMGDSQACYGKLSKEQQDKMNTEAMALVMPADGAGSAGGTAGSDAGSAAGSAAADAGSGSDAAPK